MRTLLEVIGWVVLLLLVVAAFVAFLPFFAFVVVLLVLWGFCTALGLDGREVRRER